MNCLNCNTKLSCGCQKRTASDGKNVCSTCLAAYENSLKTGQPYTPRATVNPVSRIFKKTN